MSASVGIQRHSGDLISELIECSVAAAAAPPKIQTGLENTLFGALRVPEAGIRAKLDGRNVQIHRYLYMHIYDDFNLEHS